MVNPIDLLLNLKNIDMRNPIAYLGLISLVTMFMACADDELQQIENADTIEQTFATKSCGKDGHMHSLMKDPEYQAAYQKRMEKFSKYSDSELSSRSSSTFLIPVAVHFQGISNPDLACLTIMAEDAIAALNNDF